MVEHYIAALKDINVMSELFNILFHTTQSKEAFCNVVTIIIMLHNTKRQKLNPRKIVTQHISRLTNQIIDDVC